MDTYREKDNQAKLRESDKIKVISDMSAALAHQIRNSLNAILLIIEAFSQEIGTKPEYDPYFEHLKTQIDRLSRLMGNLIEIGDSIKNIQLLRISISELFSSLISSWYQMDFSTDHKVELVLQPDCQGVFAMADSLRLQRAFLNIFKNATRNSPNGSRIQLIVTKCDNRTLIVKITDLGNEISEEGLKKFFDLFYCIRNDNLGLILSKHIIYAHGGNISIYNNEPPPGYTVEIQLPLLEEGLS